MSPALHTLTPRECEALLRTCDVGRMAISTPQGPHIVPVSYAVVDGERGATVVARVGAYSVLGSYGDRAMLAFEVDRPAAGSEPAWSVVVRGRGELVRRTQDLALPTGWTVHPWSTSPRGLLLRLRLDELSGRRLDAVTLSS